MIYGEPVGLLLFGNGRVLHVNTASYICGRFSTSLIPLHYKVILLCGDCAYFITYIHLFLCNPVSRHIVLMRTNIIHLCIVSQSTYF